MTRQQIKQEAQGRCDEAPDKPGWGDQTSWDAHIDESTDELARMDGYWVSISANIVSGTQSYACPATYRETSVVAAYPTGGTSTYPLSQLTTVDMDITYPNWRSNPATGYPTTAVFQGSNNVLLYPTPSYSQANGLIIEGFGVPSSGSATGTNVWPNATDNCPLPEQFHVAVVYGAAWHRCEQFIDNPAYAARADRLQARFLTLKRQYFRQLQEFSRGTRTGDGFDTMLQISGGGLY